MQAFLDFQSDSCAVFVRVDREAADELGDSICGVRFESAEDDFIYAMVGDAWDDELSDEENDEVFNYWRQAVEDELDAAEIPWEEGD